MTCTSYGGPETLRPADRPVPEPGRGQVQVRVVCGSVNPIDWKLAKGLLRPFKPAFPWVPGFDVAGDVTKVGEAVTEFAVGDRVHARIGDMTAGGSAEFAVAGVDVTARMPANMDYASAAGLPLAGMTALQGLRDRAGMPLMGASQRILIVGASGGVGHLGVQIARAAGATVVGVCSGRNVGLVEGLGANEVIDYTRHDPYKGQAPFDIVFDAVGCDFGTYLPLLKPGGVYATPVPGAGTFLRMAVNAISAKKVYAVMLKSAASDLRHLDKLFEDGQLRVVIDSRHPLDKLGDAWARSISGRSAGKVVVDIPG